jgi:hypothetical protein
MVGQIARLTRKQKNREYFSTIPVGTFFIITEVVDLPAYNLTGYFLNVPPQILDNGKPYSLGYIERGSWELVGSVESNILALSNPKKLTKLLESLKQHKHKNP